MRRLIVLAGLSVALCMPLSSANATETPPVTTDSGQRPSPKPDPNAIEATAAVTKLIQACHAKSQTTVSSVKDADMLKVSARYLECLRSAINMESKKLFDAKTFGLFQKNFVRFDKAANLAYEMIYRENTLCRQNEGTGCGIEATTQQDYLNEQGTVLEQVLKNVVGMSYGVY